MILSVHTHKKRTKQAGERDKEKLLTQDNVHSVYPASHAGYQSVLNAHKHAWLALNARAMRRERLQRAQAGIDWASVPWNRNQFKGHKTRSVTWVEC